MGKVQLRELEERGHYYSVPRGVSMLPMIHGGEDVVEVRRLERPARRGELILYIRGADQGVLHRVLHVREKECIIAGDNCWRREVVSHEKIVGVAATFCRRGRWHSVDEPGYRLYSWLWTLLFPVRRPLFYARDGMRSRVARVHGH